MTPEQLAIKNVGKQVKFYVNSFTTCRVIGMSLNFLDMATNCRKNKYFCKFYDKFGTYVPVSSACFVLAGSQEALGGACRRLNDVQHCAVPSCHAGHCCFSVTALCITVNITTLVFFYIK